MNWVAVTYSSALRVSCSVEVPGRLLAACQGIYCCLASLRVRCCTEACTVHLRHAQALASARLVLLHTPAGSATPGSVLPMLVSPAGTDEPGATPMRDSTNSRAGPLGRLEHMEAVGTPYSGGGRSSGRDGLQPGRLARLAAANAAALKQQDLVHSSDMHIERCL